ncbi:MAG: 3-oxoacyl-(acyl-carrier-protein) reductase [Parcubacteria group bacterium Gr01-1014_56]|nr:MAG: 3-oxoacyl-(acyl-carrier-protein) reductase [Parcubacteria group bacterium Gr01-1014_56]
MTKKNGKVVLLSGGMGGVGSATAALLIENGYRVAVLYRSSSQAEVQEKKKTLGEYSFFLQCDITDFKETQLAVKKVLDHFGAIDICIHAAIGRITRKPILEMKEEEFRSEFEAGLFGAFNLFSSALPSMKKQHEGMLIGITSSTVEAGSGARMGTYSTAKFALRGLLRELHKELKAEGISVYAVAPDLLKTALTSDLPEKYFEFAEAKTPNKKLMTPLDVAQIVLAVCRGEVKSGSSVLVSTGEVTAL